MFSATVTEQIVTVIMPSGQSMPAGNEQRKTIGQRYADRDAAVKACEEHFSVLKSALQQKVPDNSLISQAALLWEGNSGRPDTPLGIRSFDNPPQQVYEVGYAIYQTA